MRTFKEFPQTSKCPVCGTNDDKKCVLIAIAGTQDGYDMQATPVHVDCLVKKAIYSPEHGQIALFAPCNTKEQE